MFFDYLESPIGILKITADDNYVHTIEETKSIGRINSNEVIKKMKQELTDYFDGKTIDFKTPIRLIGSEFQKSVWKALQTVPYGKTASYKDIAIKINNEKSSRAVGNANNKNKLLIVVPCHRIIGSNSKLVGFRLGLEAKQYLLDLEK